MTLHSLLQYLQYKRKALSRHGVHSPFVFELIEHGLRKKKGKTLREKLTAYFSGHAVQWIDDTDLQQWHRLFQQYHLQPGQVLIFENIHRSKQHTGEWEMLKNDSRVRLSIDLFTYGLLFFSDAFREKQHFIIKYPA